MATITISREYGSGGDEIAYKVCEMLGYRYFDKTLMAQIVTETGLSESEIIDYSEDNYKMRGFLERLFAPGGSRPIGKIFSWKEDTSGTRTRETAVLSEAQGIAFVQGAIRAVYNMGNVVIVGRGGQVILKGVPGVLHVRIHAPFESRFQHIAATEAIHHFGLRKEIAEHDQAAADYLKRFYDIDWADPKLYDLVINTSQLSVDTAAHAIAEVVKNMPSPKPAVEEQAVLSKA